MLVSLLSFLCKKGDPPSSTATFLCKNSIIVKSSESSSVYFEPRSTLRQIYHFFHHQKESLLEILVSSTEITEDFLREVDERFTA